jgi:membrane associated rhomboid family serine protease
VLIPLKADVPAWRRPWVNYALIALIVAVTLAGFVDDAFFRKLAGIEYTFLGMSPPPEWARGLPGVEIRLTTRDIPLPVLALTSSLLHVGWIHLLGNMLFLWVFGNAVNYKFGQLGYLGLYVAAALLGGLAHYGFQGSPCVGASGAVNGTMGAFLVFFPRNDVTIFWIIWFRPGVSRISSGWIIVFWVLWDIFMLIIGGGGGVALWGHMGGFFTGFLIALLCAARGWIKPTPDEETLLQVLRLRP